MTSMAEGSAGVVSRVGVEDVGVVSKWTGWALLAVALSLAVVHGGAIAIAGDRVTGSADLDQITAYYSHGALLFLYWQHGLGVLLFGAFVVGFWSLMSARVTSALDRLLLGLGVVAGAAVIPVALTELGFQAGMVKLAQAGATEPLLGAFFIWDWIYNGLFYWLEVIWVGSFSLVMYRTRSVPPWLSLSGIGIAILHVFHSTVLIAGLPDSTTLPGSGLFLLWFIALGVTLVKSRG